MAIHLSLFHIKQCLQKATKIRKKDKRDTEKFKGNATQKHK